MNTINIKMDLNFREQQQYIRAKKRVKDIKGFYVHFLVYVLVNIFISCVIMYGIMSNGVSFSRAFSNFGVWATWLFWGIGMFFHWLGVFGFRSIGLGKEWEERKIKELMDKEDDKFNRF